MEEHLITDFLQSQQRKGKHPETIDKYRVNLNAFCAHMAKRHIFSFFAAGKDDLHAYAAAMIREPLSSSTRYKRIHAVYLLYEWLKENGLILCNPCPQSPKRSQSLPRVVPDRTSIGDAYKKLADTDRLIEKRDYVIIDLAYSCGLRRCELHRLNIKDIDPDNGTVRVCGKGSRERVVPIGPNSLNDLLDYVYNVRPKLQSYNHSDALFISWKGGGKRMHRYSINRVFHRLRKRYGFDRSITPHSLRHAFATHLVCNGAPIQDVSKMLGHIKLATTQIYTRIMPTDLKSHHQKYHPRS